MIQEALTADFSQIISKVDRLFSQKFKQFTLSINFCLLVIQEEIKVEEPAEDHPKEPESSSFQQIYISCPDGLAVNYLLDPSAGWYTVLCSVNIADFKSPTR